jgi:molecular chaperone GrpE
MEEKKTVEESCREAAAHSSSGDNHSSESSYPEKSAESSDADVQISLEISKYEEMIAEIKEAKKQAEANYDKYLRSLADLENVKRRAEKEKSDTIKFCLESLLKDLLPVLDSFDKAMSCAVNESAESDWLAFYQGVELVKKQLSETVAQHGLVAIEAVGAKFDPNLHQAIKKVDADVEEEQVDEEYSKGYTLNGRLVRPAMVSVAIPRD